MKAINQSCQYNSKNFFNMIIYTDRFPDYSQYQMPHNQTVLHSQSIFDEKN